MPVLKFSIPEDIAKVLEQQADDLGISLPDYIRMKLLDAAPIFTPAEAVRRCLQQYPQGGQFQLPDLYSDEEWGKLGRGPAGVFGRNFYQFIHVQKRYPPISFQGMGKQHRRAVYQYTPQEALQTEDWFHPAEDANTLPDGSTSSILTPQEAVQRARAQFRDGQPFALPDLYSDTEWCSQNATEAGQFGRAFGTYVAKHCPDIRCVQRSGSGKRARYQVVCLDPSAE